MEKRYLFLTLLMLLSILPTTAKSVITKVSGNISDENNKALPGVTVLVKSGENTYGGISDKDGNYEVNFSESDSVSITFKCLGYTALTYKIVGKNKSVRNVKMTENAINLENIEVNAQQVIKHDDNITYIPTKKQVNGAYSGIGLLFNIMIPQLKVNPMTNEVNTIDRTNLSFYIDGRKTDINEINRLRPKDVARVEYYDHPSGQFVGEEKVVNYVTKKYTTGGYVDLRATQGFINKNGDFTVQSSIDFNKFNLLAIAGTNYKKYDESGSQKSETYNLYPAFVKETITETSKSKNLQDYGLIRGTISGKKSTFIVEVKLAWKETPENSCFNNLQYNPETYKSSTSNTIVYSKNLMPSLYISHQLAISKSQTLKWTAKYDYGRNSYIRNFQESDNPLIFSNVKENIHKADIRINYDHKFKNDYNLSFLLCNCLESSNADYRGNENSHQKLNTYDIALFPQISHTFGKRLWLSLMLGFDLNSYKVNDNKSVTKLWPRPGLNVYYHIDNSSSISFAASEGSVTPQLSMLNEAEQYISAYEVMRGNPNLKTGKIINGYITYGKYIKNLSLSTFVKYRGVIDIAKIHYMVENNKMIQTFNSNGNYHSLLFGISGSISLFNKSLNLNISADYDNTLITGENSVNLHKPNLYASAYYSLGDFSFYATYSTPSTMINGSTDYYKRKCQYQFAAMWQHRGLSIQIGCQQIFDKHGSIVQYGNYGNYKFHERQFSKQFGQAVYVTLSYNFDFGRQVKHEKINVNTNGNSGILHP